MAQRQVGGEFHRVEVAANPEPQQRVTGRHLVGQQAQRCAVGQLVAGNGVLAAKRGDRHPLGHGVGSSR
ncbi:Uncharacterised protein [Mycobacteroides abscessus subsp. abscessus]|nr:Uncharacterised protein [Mycobacteroides abscessus subsp. abscessus]